MIDPKLSQQRRFGIQGGVSFDPKTANVPLYKSIETFLKGVQGLGGSGGTLANAPQLAAGFQQSHVFNNMSMRQQVQDRLEKQLTEHLQSLVGEQAAAQNMSIPSFLQSQGIRGISETKTGNLSAYKTDNFLKTSFNPIASSTERMAKASMKMSGALPTVSGGSNEHRRLSAYLRAPEARHIVGMVQQTADEITSGTYNKGPMEGLYASAGDRADARSRQKTIQNIAGTFDLENRSPSALEEAKSMMLKQQAKKDLYSSAKQELIASGELPDDKPAEKERKTSPATAAAKGGMAVMSKIAGVAQEMKSVLLSSLAYLQKMAGFLGNMMKDKGALGVSDKEAEQLRDWGRMHTVYSGNDPQVLLNAGKAFATGTGDILQAGGADFKSAGLHQYAGLIDIIIGAGVKGIEKPEPVKTMKKAYGYMAQDYYRTPAELRPAKLAEQMSVLDRVVPGSAQAYNSSIQWGNDNGVNSDNAYNIVNMMLGRKESLDGYAATTSVTGGRKGSTFASRASTKALDEIGEAKTLIEDSIAKMILANMDTIIKILLAIGTGLLKVAALVENDKNGPAAQALRDLQEIERGKAKAGYKEMVRSGAKVKKTLLEDLAENGYKGENAEKLISDFNAAEDPAEFLRSTHLPFLKKKRRDIVIGLSKFRQINEQVKEHKANPDDFTGLGDLDNYYRKNTSTSKLLRDVGFVGGEAEISEKDFNRVNRKKVKDADIRELEYRNNAGGVSGVRGFSDPTGEALKRIGGIASRGALNLDPAMSAMISSLTVPGKLSASGVGGSLSGQNDPFVISHKFELSVNGTVVTKKSDTFAMNSEKRYLLDNSQGTAKV